MFSSTFSIQQDQTQLTAFLRHQCQYCIITCLTQQNITCFTFNHHLIQLTTCQLMH